MLCSTTPFVQIYFARKPRKYPNHGRDMWLFRNYPEIIGWDLRRLIVGGTAQPLGLRVGLATLKRIGQNSRTSNSWRTSKGQDGDLSIQLSQHFNVCQFRWVKIGCNGCISNWVGQNPGCEWSNEQQITFFLKPSLAFQQQLLASHLSSDQNPSC